MPAPLYDLDDGWFVPSELTRGPWSPDAQHGGPLAALLTREIEGVQPTSFFSARISVDLLGAVPLAPLRITTSVVREGRRIQLVESTAATEDETPRATARAWRIRSRDPLQLNQEPDTAYPPPIAPEDSPPAGELLQPLGYTHFVSDALERRLADGHYDLPGPASVWFRWKHPLVAGERPTGTQMAMGVADTSQGISWMTTPWEHSFINVDVSGTFWRAPEGEWIGLRARSRLNARGYGASDTVMFDTNGDVGRANQTILVDGPQ